MTNFDSSGVSGGKLKGKDQLKNIASMTENNLDFEQALFRYGQDPHDPYEKSSEVTKGTADGFEELFVRDNLHRLPEDLDQIT